MYVLYHRIVLGLFTQPQDELVYLLTNLHSPTQASRLYKWRGCGSILM